MCEEYLDLQRHTPKFEKKRPHFLLYLKLPFCVREVSVLENTSRVKMVKTWWWSAGFCICLQAFLVLSLKNQFYIPQPYSGKAALLSPFGVCCLKFSFL